MSQLTHHAPVAEGEDDNGNVRFRWECNCTVGGRRQHGAWTTSRATAERNGRRHETTKNAANATGMQSLRALLKF